MDITIAFLIAAAVLLLVIFIALSYVKAPPSYAFIISGLSREPRVLIGSGGFRIPFLERLDKVYLGQITVDIKTEVRGHPPGRQELPQYVTGRDSTAAAGLAAGQYA